MDFSQNTPYDTLVEKWNPLLAHEALPDIGDSYKKKVTAVLLENQEKALRQQYITEYGNQIGGGYDVSNTAVNTGLGNAAGNLAGYDPILISLVRRAMPNLMAYDLAGVQPMTAPTGLIFAMRSRYGTNDNKPTPGNNSSYLDGKRTNEALFQEAFAKFGGSGGQTQGAAFSATGGVAPVTSTGFTLTTGDGVRALSVANFNDFRAMLTSTGEQLGVANGRDFNEMSFSIERVAVEAKTRALRASYTTELAQDLKAVHGLDAESELANILSSEILNEINRELISTIYRVAKTGCQQTDLTSMSTIPGVANGYGGIYDLNTDSDGRWSAERFRGLMFQIEREANVIAKETRRGKGNFIVCSSDVASALAMGGFLNLTPALQPQLEVDDTGNTFAGILNGKFKVYIDPYAQLGLNFVTVGYRGASPYDAGLFYCPYVPLQMVRSVGENTFQPKIGFKTRYGMVANPFSESMDLSTAGTATSGNVYYRMFRVDNLHGNTGFGL
jgi:hypothetical protein